MNLTKNTILDTRYQEQELNNNAPNNYTIFQFDYQNNQYKNDQFLKTYIKK